MSVIRNPLVITRPIYSSQEKCGYCDGKKKDPFALESQNDKDTEEDWIAQSTSIGVSVELMTAEHYDSFINQGFRRSGTYLYKPDPIRGCCRLYTIRTNYQHLNIIKKHRQVINRFIRAISPEEIVSEQSSSTKKNGAFRLESLLEAEQNCDKSIFYTRYEPSHFSKEKFELYKKYQIAVHNDDPDEITKESFKRFLCDSPFPEPEIEGTKPQWDKLNNWVKNWNPNESSSTSTKRIGPTHECYYYKQKLIAISVLDFLPSGLSSIYFIWDPDYAHLSLGTLSGLREILMCKELNLGYYYLGFYIEDCEKMVYKRRFGGEILDLANETYIPFETFDKFASGNGRYICFGKDTEREPEILKLGHPSNLNESSQLKLPLQNIASDIYKFGSTSYKLANESLEQAQKRFKLKKQKQEHFIIPPMVPGLIPYWQLLSLSNEIDHMNVNIFQMMYSNMIEDEFKELDGDKKSIILDCVRLFGIEQVSKAIILV
ncbi:arginyl-tRNA--protein transferase 1 [[Candida] anglica]|uniref:arginyltransferase n=1 Tax=[Candida] anglica TaxID=148631 RepID=A0ABP0EA44_9ASCO